MTAPQDPAGNNPRPGTDRADERLLLGDEVDPDEMFDDNVIDAEPAPPANPAGDADLASLDREELQSVLEGALAERNEYLEALRRLQAEFENYRKRSLREQAEAGVRATERMATSMLPVLDSIDLSRTHGEVGPISSQLLAVLGSEGLEQLDPTGEPFDPNEHEAVMHSPGGGDGGPVVAEVLRSGWRFKGRVIRPAMVRVEG